MDLGIEVILSIFTKRGLSAIFESRASSIEHFSKNSKRIFFLKEDYINKIEDVISFLQGKKPTLARQISAQNFLPEASRFTQVADLDYAFGLMGMQDKAKHLATLFLEDLSDFISENVDENFGFSRYAERLGRSANQFNELYTALNQQHTYIDTITLTILKEKITEQTPKLIVFSVPFPGNLYSAFRCAKFIKKQFPETKIALGGGFANTELRSLTDPRVFEFFDYISLDDGELPIELIYQNTLNQQNEYKRTFILEDNKVVFKDNSLRKDYKQKDIGTPDYSDLLLNQYISVIEITNPMHSLWSDGRWNKLTMAHGCYWGKCTFCDISLDYIRLYEPISAKILVDRMEEMIASTGETGFHFVDEAAPPALMKEVALEIIKRKLVVTWWTNIRFEKSFTYDLCRLLQYSGCIAISGGLEVASDRLLNLIDKGVTVAQVADVTRNLTEAGIMVHAYLMYGYPTQTEQETIDSVEMVRQLFELGIVQSGFWHQFALTAHSPIGKNPEAFGIVPHLEKIEFADNDVQFTDSTGVDHSKFSYGLTKSVFNYMHGIGFELPIDSWFDFEVPQTLIAPDYLAYCLSETEEKQINTNQKIIYLGALPHVKKEERKKKGKTKSVFSFHFQTLASSEKIILPELEGQQFNTLLTYLQERQTPEKIALIEKNIGLNLEKLLMFPAIKESRATIKMLIL